MKLFIYKLILCCIMFLSFFLISNSISCAFVINLNSQIITMCIYIFVVSPLYLINAQTKLQHDARFFLVKNYSLLIRFSQMSQEVDGKSHKEINSL
jgi:hypothetical protein